MERADSGPLFYKLIAQSSTRKCKNFMLNLAKKIKNTDIRLPESPQIVFFWTENN